MRSRQVEVRNQSENMMGEVVILAIREDGPVEDRVAVKVP